MSPRLEEILVFAVMSILVGLFAWIYARQREETSRLWLLGWVAIFIHFAAPLVDDFVAGWPASLTAWINRATLIVAGTFFLFSVNEVYAHSRWRPLSMLLTSGAAMVYATAWALRVQRSWLFVALLVASTLAALGHSLSYYGWKSWLWRGVSAIVVPYTAFTAFKAIHHSTGYGLDQYLCLLFALTGILYYRHFRRLSPGVAITAVAFVLWGLVFPAGRALHASQIDLSAVVWDLPKYFVAFGMILTLYENQTQVATAMARQFQGFFESNLAAVYVATLEGKLLDCNTAFVKMYGYDSKEEALANSTMLLCSSGMERDSFMEALHLYGKVLNYECRHHRKDGTPFWILERATIVTDSAGRQMVEGTAIDITERKQAEIALQQSEERFSTIFRQSPIGCAIVSLDGVFLDVNETLMHMTGLRAEQTIGKTGVELGFWKTPQQRDAFYKILRTERALQNMRVEFKDASGNWHEGLYFATLVGLGEKECIFGMLLDRTEQRDLEAKFLQSQKMEALGRLAGGVAHDFNNLLGVIGGYAELLETKLGPSESLRAYCSKILDTTQRAGGLTRQLLTFSRKEITRPTALRLDQAIRELAAILPRMIGEDIELSLDLRSTGIVVMDQTHFEQIILNVVVNSRDAMPHGGRLHIETQDIVRPMMNAAGKVDMGRYVALRLRDNGSGMDEETRAHAFEPFYTTKGIGRGTGLGLATVYGIVQHCRGEISIESKLGHGTQISILLPAGEGVETPAASPSADVVKGTGNILLVEDEAELRNTNAEFLTSIGYSVMCASSGPEALALAHKAGNIDLVISDVVMPRMNGREFADQLLQVRPSAKLLFVSGYADDVVLQNGLSTPGTPFLQKPYSLKQLGSKVNELLGAVTAPSADERRL